MCIRLSPTRQIGVNPLRTPAFLQLCSCTTVGTTVAMAAKYIFMNCVDRLPLIMLNNGIKANQIAGVIYDEHRGEIQPRDIHRIQQTNWENAKSLSDSNLSTSEMQNLIAEINKNNDKYRIKFKGNTLVMDCFFYWNPANVQFARHFCQVYPSMT